MTALDHTRAVIVATSSLLACSESTDGRDAEDVSVEASGGLQDASPSFMDARADGSQPTDGATDGLVAPPMDAGEPHDASGMPILDAAGFPTPTAAEALRVLEHFCADCHRHQGSDGFLFDGQLRATLLAHVEAAPSPVHGEPPGAAACRTEKRVQPGNANSYLIRKIQLGLGQRVSPDVCGQGMPRALALGPEDIAELTRDLEVLKRWIVGGAPLE